MLLLNSKDHDTFDVNFKNHVMGKLNNWLLPILMIIAAVLESSFSLIQEVLNEFGAGPKWVLVLRLAAIVIGSVILKLQAPSKKKAKLAKEGYHPKL